MDSANMGVKKNFLISIVYFVLGLSILIGLDYSIRFSSKNYNQLGVNETIWFVSHILIALLVIFFFLKRTKKIRLKRKILLTTLLSFLGFVLYTILIYGYVLGSGIDSL